MVYYGSHDDKLCEIFADLFLGVTPGGLGKRNPLLDRYSTSLDTSFPKIF